MPDHNDSNNDNSNRPPFLSCRTSFKRVAAISALSFAAFLGGTQYILPEIVPGRGLTEGEVALLQPYFGAALDYGAVKIHSSGLTDTIAAEGFEVFTVGNTIFYTDRDYRDDFSKGGMRGTFIHEITHVWQQQNCQKDNVFHTMFNTMRSKFGWSPEQNYEYELQAGKDLTGYHAEHQASIVEDYDRVLHGHMPIGLKGAFRMSLSDGPHMKALYEDTLENFIRNPAYTKQECFFNF